MIGAGTFISPLIKIVTTVAILAAIYFFIVKPVLDTTDNAIDRGFNSIDGVGPGVERAVRQAERIQGSQQASSEAQIEEANKLLRCITKAGQDVERINRCNAKFDPANP